MSKRKRLVLVDIDEFEAQFRQQISETSEWVVSDIFGTDESGFEQLTFDGLLRIVKPAVEILSNLDADQNKRQTIDQQALNLCYEIEKLPASEQQTTVSILAAELRQRVAR